MNGKLWNTAIACVAVVTGACHSATDDAPVDEAARLQALLHDEALNQVPPSATAQIAAAVAPPPDPGPPPPPGGPGTPDAPGLLSAWSFDDCVPDRTGLFDQTGTGNTAFRAVDVACTAGIHGSLGVAIAATEDIVYVPDQPSFTFEHGVTVAGWFNPANLRGTRTLFRKRDQDTSSFALVLDADTFEWVISLGHGRAVSVAAPRRAKPGVFQHVAATYDGTMARLYVDGREVAHRAVAGEIPRGPGPLLIGNDGSERRFTGAIDDAMFATHALAADEVLQLTCLPEPPTLVFSPLTLPPTAAGETQHIDIAFTNHNPAVCAPVTFLVQPNPEPGLVTDPIPQTFGASAPVPSGQTGHFSVSVRPSSSVDPGTLLGLGLVIIEPTARFVASRSFDMVVAEPAGCHVATARELMITNLSVVDDPVRTDPATGAWTFKRLMENLAPTPADAPAMVEALLATMTTDRTINGFKVAGRPGVQTLVLDTWPRTPAGALDLAHAPLRLQAIVNRFDLRNLAHGDAGEGRFVFAFEHQGTPDPFQATMIFEFKLPATSDADVRGWADAFHRLGALPFGEDYNVALQAITDRFTGRGARPGHPNGSAINTVRTDEIDFGDNGIWELREFRLSATSGRLEPVPVELTPDRGFNNSAALASYITANRDAIVAETHTVPAVFDGQPFQGGAVFNDLTSWDAPGVDTEARHHFAINTCNGCHSLEETVTLFLQISPRTPGFEAGLSSFLTGVVVSDPVTGVPRVLDDLDRRNTDLKAVVCDDAAARAIAGTTLRKGISRVH